MTIEQRLAAELALVPEAVAKTIALLDEGSTVPFIARYRKEVTGGMDDQTLRRLNDRLAQLRALEERRADVRRLIDETGHLTPEVEQALVAAETLTTLEDLYRPFRPRRRTRAAIARERGLEPLAQAMLTSGLTGVGWTTAVQAAVQPDSDVPDEAAALAGARDIVAEQLADEPALRDRLRRILQRTGRITAKRRKKTEESVYDRYDGHSEALATAAGHRILALNRGEKEAFLSVGVEMEDGLALQHALAALPAAALGGPAGTELHEAAEDAWKRLILPSLATEMRNELTERAELEAIDVFAANLRQLLMTRPLRGQTVLAVDPAYRTGCKVAVLDPTGRVLQTGVIYPTPPQNRTDEATRTVFDMARHHRVTVVAIGNGTASRETEQFFTSLTRQLLADVQILIVNEAGASVYSASELGAAEFPELDVTLRSAISIGRRLQDPLAELVKIEPQSIGVGQYQHDLNPKRLSESLGGVVESCVNEVGCDLNTASPQLLGHIAGISRPVAQNIVAWREQNGRFTTRAQLREVPRLGPKAYEQCAGFLRVVGGDEPLDATRIHPESYGAARQIRQLEAGFDPAKTATQLGIGLPTLRDIIEALADPDFDPRRATAQAAPPPEVTDIADLKPEQILTGVVRNVTAFGAFVDIGVHQDGLVHLSELADRYVARASDVVSVGQSVRVRVLAVDTARKRISLSMKGVPQ